MWAVLVVVGHPFLKDRLQMPFVQNNQPIQTLSTDRADQLGLIRSGGQVNYAVSSVLRSSL